MSSVPGPIDLRAALEQTTAWREAAAAPGALEAALAVARDVPAKVLERLARARRITITGAGSSYYVAQIGASVMRQASGLPAQAVPLSEVLLRPRGVFLPGTTADQPVIVVSRSGTTSEAVAVVDRVRAAGHHAIAVTARPASALASRSDQALSVPRADEQAIVMTRSFAALTTLLMRVAARLVPDTALATDLDAMPSAWQETRAPIERAIELAASDPRRVVILGGGAAFGLANEAVLKLTETSQVPASAFEPLEFRHGPISVCEPGMLVVGLLGGASEAAERRVVDESAELGATTWVIGPEGPGRALGELARIPLLLHPLQALALSLALRRGCDPERPRHLSQVVVLSDP